MPIVGDVLAGRYRIDGRLGAGGMASVWRARDLRLERDVAIKVLLPNLAADPTIARRFDREARTLASAAHPGVIAVYDVEPGDPDTGREPFYVMELADGGSLADRLATQGRLAPDELVPIIATIADGLAELHRGGMVHRDIKAHNIVFVGDRPKLADFGLARSGEVDDLTALTQTGTTVGTMAYLAPELLSGQPASPASDVYALAVVAFQGLTGRLPRPSGSVTEIVESRTLPAASPSEVTPELGTRFDPPLGAALSPDPTLRPTPSALAEDLSRAMTDPAIAPVPAPIPPPPPIRVSEPEATLPDWAETTVIQRPEPATAPRARGRPALIALGLFALVLLLLLAAANLFGRPDGTPTPSPSAPAALPPSEPPPPSPSDSPSPPPPSPTPPPDSPIAGPVNEVLDRIADAQAVGLGAQDADRLRRIAEDVRGFFDRGDLRQARDRAERLVDETDDVEDALPDEQADALLRAVEGLRDSIPE